jgi:hypothetical protein
MKFCKDCSFVVDDSKGGVITDLAHCGRNREMSLVTGSLPETYTLPFCKIERREGENCGPAAMYWIPNIKAELKIVQGEEI